MNITRLNFAQTLPFIKEIINQSHYVSIDLEMSGIVSDPGSNPSLIDSMQQRYAKTRNRIEKFIPLQLGLCCHRIDSAQNKVTFYPFNFYIYPLTLKEADSVKFAFHSSSLNFLAKNSFDFNKLFYEYVPYISKEELKNTSERQEYSEIMKELMRLDTLSAPTTKAFVNMHLPLVEKWVEENSEGELKVDVSYVKFKSYMTLVDEIQRKFASMTFDFTFDSEQVFNRSWLTIKRKTETPQGGESSAFGSYDSKDANDLVLINEVFDCIVEKQLPLIVHNGLLDLMHIFLRLFESLPPTWQVFCQKLHSFFPNLYDTKFICSNYPVLFQTLQRQTNLENCYLKLKQEYQKKDEEQRKQFYSIEIDSEFKEYELDGAASHEAGFDAMMTGYVFFRAMDKLKKPLESLEKKKFHKNPSLMRNRIPLGNLKVPLNLQQLTDHYIQHSNTIFQVKSLLQTIHTDQEIIEHFKKQEGTINFYWRDQTKTSFFITFIDQKQEDAFVKKYLDSDGLGIVQFLGDKYLITTQKNKKIVAKNDQNGEGVVEKQCHNQVLVGELAEKKSESLVI